jgi:hypothetical protein
VAVQIAPVAGARLAPEDLDGWVVGPVDEGEDGDEDGHEHALEHTQDEHPGQGDQGEGVVPEPDPADAAQGGQVDQPDHGHDHDRAQGRLGQVLEQRGQEQQGEDHDQGRGDAGELAAGAALAVDGRLGEAAAGREGLEAAPGQVGRAEGAQLLVGVDPGLVPGGEARPAAIDSTNDIRAIPAAGTTSSRARLRSGATRWGRPGGMAPTRATPRSASPVAAASRIPRATTSSGPGSDGGAQRRHVRHRSLRPGGDWT